MRIFVLNAGSSSLKCSLIESSGGLVLAQVSCERIGIDGKVKYKTHTGKELSYDALFPDHSAAFSEVIKLITSGESAVLSSLGEVGAIGHRIAVGGAKFTQPVLIDSAVIAEIEVYRDLAPLHTPPQVATIDACKALLGDSVPQVAVFDTGFHMTMPEKAYIYPLPYKYYRRYGIRRFGFHGISHQYVSERAAALMGKDPKDLSMVICHLGNGSSMSAIKGGKSVDVTTGFGTFDGLMMGSRCGSVDPAVFFYLGKKEHLDYDQLIDIATKKSGLLGITGLTSDHREVEKEAFIGNPKARLALDIQIYQIKKYIGSFAFAMGSLDAVVFTGGIGERAPSVRQGVCEGLSLYGFAIDNALNAGTRGVERDVSLPESKVRIWVVPTNEEFLIAQQTAKIVADCGNRN